MLPSANAHFAGNAGSLYSRNGLLWLSPYWLSAACRSRQILRDLSKIIQAGALLFEQHGELQIQGVGCLGQPGRYTGRSTDTKLRKIYCFVFHLNLFFCFLSLTQRAVVPQASNPGRPEAPSPFLTSPSGIPWRGGSSWPGKEGGLLRSPLLCSWDQGTGGARSGSSACTSPCKERKLHALLHVALENGNYPRFPFLPAS